jgi:hypothetical protein
MIAPQLLPSESNLPALHVLCLLRALCAESFSSSSRQLAPQPNCFRTFPQTLHSPLATRRFLSTQESPQPLSSHAFTSYLPSHPGCTHLAHLSFNSRSNPITAIPFRMIFFAHPHDLTPIESHSYKKQGGWGYTLPLHSQFSLISTAHRACDTVPRAFSMHLRGAS